MGAIFQWLSGLITLAFLVLFLAIGLLTKYETGAFNAHESLSVAFATIFYCVACLVASLSYLGTFRGIVLVLLILIFLFINDIARSRRKPAR
jgi:ABC-type xylose transport system permease subunit